MQTNIQIPISQHMIYIMVPIFACKGRLITLIAFNFSRSLRSGTILPLVSDYATVLIQNSRSILDIECDDTDSKGARASSRIAPHQNLSRAFPVTLLVVKVNNVSFYVPSLSTKLEFLEFSS